MSTDSANSLRRQALLWTALAFALFAGGVAAYGRWGEMLVQDLRANYGEMLMGRGIALDRAGLKEDAKAAYRSALSAGFAGLQNRAMTLKHLGTILLEQGAPADAIPLFEASIATGRHPISVYKEYVAALAQLERWQDIDRVTPRWLAEAEAAAHPLEMARAHCAAGMGAKRRGDETAALEHFRQGNAALPGRGNALELAQGHADRHEPEEARARIEEVIRTGPSPEEFLRAVRILESLGIPL